MPLTIGETIKQLHAALRDYIEATYHISHPKVIEQRRALLNEPGVIHQRPYLESTPRYKTGGRFADFGLPSSVLEIFTAVTSPAGEKPRLIHDPPYHHQAEAVVKTLVEGRSLVVMTGTGSGKTECFLLPILGKLAREAHDKGEQFGKTTAVRALVLYPMNALVNDQLGRLRLLFGEQRIVDKLQRGQDVPQGSLVTPAVPYIQECVRRRKTSRVSKLLQTTTSATSSWRRDRLPQNSKPLLA